MENKEVTIKEIMELMKAIEVIAVAGSKVAKDKKIGADDLLVLIDLMKEIEVLKDGFTGLGELPKEAKNLEKEEMVEIVMGVFSIVEKVKAALK